MRLTRHATKRLQQRGLDLAVLKIVEEVVIPEYCNQSQQLFFTRRKAVEIGSMIRRLADRVEKSAGIKMILDPSGSTLYTAYRLKNKKDDKKRYRLQCRNFF